MQNIGAISLNISFVIYFIWFIPQIVLNFKRKNTEGLSLLMHTLLCLGYLCDLIYGFGLKMQWQYRMVTCTGLLCLTIQHYQFGKYELFHSRQKMIYVLLSVIFLFLFGYGIHIIFYHQPLFVSFIAHYFNLNDNQQNFYDSVGMLTNVCWFSYALPQIWTNFKLREAQGLSLVFILFSIFLNLCDSTSAWALQWDYPSKIGPLIALLQNSILLSQVIYYAKHNRQRIKPMVIDSRRPAAFNS